MKKIINIKEIMIILISVLLITVSTSVFASDLVLGTGNGNATTLTGNEYENAQTIPTDNTNTGTTGNESANNEKTNLLANNNTNTAKKYNTNNTSDLPQTGIEDYNIGILLVICIASAMFAYKKITDYKNI